MPAALRYHSKTETSDKKMETKAISAAVEAQSGWMEATLRELVEVESPSDDKAAVDEAVGWWRPWEPRLGGRVKLHKQKAFGDVLELRFGTARRGGSRCCCWGIWTRFGRWERWRRCPGGRRRAGFGGRACWI